MRFFGVDNKNDSHLQLNHSKSIVNSTPNPSHIMIVCICRNISDREIAKSAKAGLNFDDIQFETGLSSQCGSCENCARDVIAQCGAMGQVAYLRKEAAAQVLHCVLQS